jgi:hypothetical protein
MRSAAVAIVVSLWLGQMAVFKHADCDKLQRIVLHRDTPATIKIAAEEKRRLLRCPEPIWI